MLFCAKERRKLPNHGYTCCFALDGVNIVTSGFDKDVKVKCHLPTTNAVKLYKAYKNPSFILD